MTPKRLTAFALTAAHGSITKAAEAMNVSQPTLSKQLSALEKQIGAALFQRNGNRVQITELGETLLADIQPLLAQFEEIRRKYGNGATNKASPDNRLRIASTYGPASEILPRLLSKYRSMCPDVEIDLRTSHNREIEASLLNRRIELAVISRRVQSPELECEPFVPMTITAFAAKSSALSKKTTLTLADLEKLPLVVRSASRGRGATEVLLEKMRRQGYRPKVVMHCESPEALKTAVRNGVGIGFLFDDAVKQAIARGGFIRLRLRGLDMRGQTQIIYHKARPLSFHAAAFLKLLRQWRDGELAQTKTSARSAKPLAWLPLIHLVQGFAAASLV